jgi:hypothetical protein
MMSPPHPGNVLLTGARLRFFVQAWATLIADPWCTSIVQHEYYPEVTTTRYWPRGPMYVKASTCTLRPAEEAARRVMVDESWWTPAEGYRGSLDCRYVNQYIESIYFKMDFLRALRDMSSPGDYMVKLDLRHAYLVVPINPHARPAFRFRAGGDWHGRIRTSCKHCQQYAYQYM